MVRTDRVVNCCFESIVNTKRDHEPLWTPSLLDNVLRHIFNSFSIVYADFNSQEYGPYRERGIGAFVRFDQKTIFFDRHLPSHEEDRTWAHEILSIYYYHMLGVIRHDDEVEREARLLCQNDGCLSVLRHYRRLVQARGPKSIL